MATKKPREVLWTPAGRFSFPYFNAPDTGRQYSDNKFKTDLLISKADFKLKARGLQDAVIKVGKEYFGDKFSLKGKWKVPFKDTDTDEKIENEGMKSCILIRAKSDSKPIFLSPRKGADGKFAQLAPEDIGNIKGGDWGVLNVTVYPYDQQGGGVTFGLNAVQYWKADDGFGQGVSRLIETAAELEAEIDEATNDDAGTDAQEDSVI